MKNELKLRLLDEVRHSKAFSITYNTNENCIISQKTVNLYIRK